MMHPQRTSPTSPEDRAREDARAKRAIREKALDIARASSDVSTVDEVIEAAKKIEAYLNGRDE